LGQNSQYADSTKQLITSYKIFIMARPGTVRPGPFRSKVSFTWRLGNVYYTTDP